MKYLITLLCLLGMTSVKSQKVFEPARVDFNNEYQLFLVHTLIGKSNQYYLCTPSFFNEYALSLHDNKLVYVCAVEDIYNSFRLKGSKVKAKTQQFQLTVTNRQIWTISQLLLAAAETSNTYNDKRMGDDGVTYTLNSCGHMVKTWNPQTNTLPYRTVKVMDSLCIAVKTADHALLERLLDTCKSLTTAFRTLYPLYYFAPEKFINQDSTDANRIVLRTLGCDYNLYIELACDDVHVTETESYMESLKDSVTLWSRELFLRSDNHVNIILSDTDTAYCRVRNNYHNINYYIIITIPRFLLNKEIILGTINLNEGRYYLAPDGTWIPMLSKD